jgi:copper resistance protein B
MTRASVRLALLLLFVALAALGFAQTGGLTTAPPPQAGTPVTDAPNTSAQRGWPKPTADNATFGLLLFDNFEYQGSGDLHWDGYGWRGGDYRRLWIKSEGSQATDGGTDNDGDFQLLYGKLISPFVDLQLGGRVAGVWGGGSSTARVFAVIGLQALTPYSFDIEPTLFLSNKGEFSARFTGTYDVLLSQKLIFQPRLETNLAAQADREFRVGSGFNDLEVGSRLRYEIRRELAPYVGVSWRQNFGETKTLQLLNGAERRGFSVVFGIRVWR